MKKNKTVFICSSCGNRSIKWQGKCPECGGWNTFVEEKEETGKSVTAAASGTAKRTISLKEISTNDKERIKTYIDEFDRVLGGGILPGAVVLLGGEPGIGKSTLVLQAAAALEQKVLYVTGEESLTQIKLRAERLKVKQDTQMLSENMLGSILSTAEEIQPGVLIVDSIQTIYNTELENSPGTVTQIRECTYSLMEFAKRTGVAVIIIGHVTKDGSIAGPKILEHMVDTVLQFEGNSNHSYRIIRALKNRFGSTNEIGIFEMHEEGLIEVRNPSELFISNADKRLSGSVVTASVEGTRPILLEVQSLVSSTAFGYPQRVCNGFDTKRLAMLLAVLEKRGGRQLTTNDVFLNIAGGIRIEEPAADLAVCVAVVSALSDKPVKAKTVVLGEVGLGGELRAVSAIEKRLQECEKLGFNNVVLPAANLKKLYYKAKIQLIPCETLQQALYETLH